MNKSREVIKAQVRLEEAYLAALQAKDSRGLRIMLIPYPVDIQALCDQILTMSRDLHGDFIRMTPGGVERDALGVETLANNLTLVTEVYAALLAWKRLTKRRETTMDANS